MTISTALRLRGGTFRLSDAGRLDNAGDIAVGFLDRAGHWVQSGGTGIASGLGVDLGGSFTMSGGTFSLHNSRGRSSSRLRRD